jgi:hypothetical protein
MTKVELVKVQLSHPAVGLMTLRTVTACPRSSRPQSPWHCGKCYARPQAQAQASPAFGFSTQDNKSI